MTKIIYMHDNTPAQAALYKPHPNKIFVERWSYNVAIEFTTNSIDSMWSILKRKYTKMEGNLHAGILFGRLYKFVQLLLHAYD